MSIWKWRRFLGKEIKDNKTEEFNEYLRFGGFPKTLEFDNPADKDTYIADVIKQILEKDVTKHKKIRNRAVFDKVMTYVINNFGATVSLSSIAEYFENCENIKIRTETLNNYLKILENAKIIYRCPRFEVKSKNHFGVNRNIILPTRVYTFLAMLMQEPITVRYLKTLFTHIFPQRIIKSV